MRGKEARRNKDRESKSKAKFCMSQERNSNLRRGKAVRKKKRKVRDRRKKQDNRI